MKNTREAGDRWPPPLLPSFTMSPTFFPYPVPICILCLQNVQLAFQLLGKRTTKAIRWTYLHSKLSFECGLVKPECGKTHSWHQKVLHTRDLGERIVPNGVPAEQVADDCFFMNNNCPTTFTENCPSAGKINHFHVASSSWSRSQQMHVSQLWSAHRCREGSKCICKQHCTSTLPMLHFIEIVPNPGYFACNVSLPTQLSNNDVGKWLQLLAILSVLCTT